MTHLNAVKFVSNAKKTVKGEYLSERLTYLSSLLGEPHKRLNYLRLAGSNGKTICSAMLSSVITEAGYGVCSLNMSLMSDPKDNIRLGTSPISISEFTELVGELYAAYGKMKKELKKLKKDFDSSEYGGAILLGLAKPVIKSHGSSKAKEIKIAIGQASEYASSGIIDEVSSALLSE